MQCRESDNCDRDVEWHTVGIVEVGNLNDFDRLKCFFDKMLCHGHPEVLKISNMCRRQAILMPFCRLDSTRLTTNGPSEPG